MKIRSVFSLFACVALAASLVGCGSSDDSTETAQSAPGPAEVVRAQSAPGPAEVVRTVFDAILSGDHATFLKNTTDSFPRAKEEFKKATAEGKEFDVRFHVGKVRMDGDIARVSVSFRISDEVPREGESDVIVRKVNGVWKVDGFEMPDDSESPYRVADHGKDIVMAIVTANIDREASMRGPLWPGKGKWEDSNAYFARLMGDGGKVQITGVRFSDFAGGGIEPAADLEDFKQRGNIWTMLAGIGTCSDSRMPFIWTRNLRLTKEDLEDYVRDPYTERSLADRLDPSVKPFGDDVVVMITKNGLMYPLKASRLTTEMFFGGAVPEDVDALEIVEPRRAALGSSYGSAERVRATRTTISSIESAAQTWETRHFKKPDSLDRLLEPDGDREPLLPAKARTDAWGNEIQYRLNGRRMEIRSAGPDGRMNTSDDVTN